MSWDLKKQVLRTDQIQGGGGKEREAPPTGGLLGHSAEAADMGMRDSGQFIISSGLKMRQFQGPVLSRCLQSVVVTSGHITRM